jgi:outer membrane murein-binding lipoprotein Lpp
MDSYQVFLDDFIHDKPLEMKESELLQYQEEFDSQLVDMNQFKDELDLLDQELRSEPESTIYSQERLPSGDLFDALDLTKELDELDQEYQATEPLELTHRGLEELDLSYQEPTNASYPEQIQDPWNQPEDTPTRPPTTVRTYRDPDDEYLEQFAKKFDEATATRISKEEIPFAQSESMSEQDSTLASQVNQLKQQIEILLSQKQDLEVQHKLQLDKVHREHQYEISQLRNEILQIQEIKASIEKEKEIDVLTIKKELLEQQERTLQQLRQEIDSEKEHLRIMYEKKLLQQSDYDLRPKIIELLNFETTITDNEIVSEVQQLVATKNTYESTLNELKEQKQQDKRKLEVLQTQCHGLETLFEDKLIKVKQNHESILEQYKKQFVGEKLELEHSHGRELASLKEQYEKELEGLRKSSRDQPTSVSSLLQTFPVLMTQYRHQLEQSFEHRLENQVEIRNAEILHLKSQIEALMSEKENAEHSISVVIEKVKKECTQLYEQSLQKLVGDYKSMEKQVLQRFQTTISQFQQRIAELELMLDQKQAQLHVIDSHIGTE